MKTAYEVAIERLERQGIEGPRESGLDPAAREKIADVRGKTEAKLAQLEIMLQDRLRKLEDPVERAKAEEDYAEERRRLEEKRDWQISRIREQGSTG